MIEKDDTMSVKELSENALLMLSMWEKTGDLTPEEREMYQSLISAKDANKACNFMLSVVMRYYAEETGRTKEEISAHIRNILLGISQLEG